MYAFDGAAHTTANTTKEILVFWKVGLATVTSNA